MLACAGMTKEDSGMKKDCDGISEQKLTPP